MGKIIHISEEHTLNRPQPRIGWVDNAKALGIFLVVLGHTYHYPTFGKTLIYCFHMPLFFFLSGYLLKQSYLDIKFKNYIWHAFRILIIPYISFWTISFGFRIATYSFSRQLLQKGKLSYTDQIYGFLFGISGTLRNINSALWFFTCLFCTMILFYWLPKKQKTGMSVALLALLGLTGPMFHNFIDYRLPWNLDISFVAVVFFGIGYIISKSATFATTRNLAHQVFALAILFVILIITAKINGKVNMASMQFKNLLLFYIGAFSGIGVAILLSQMIPKNACFEWLSRNTITIFATHILTLTVFKGLSLKFLDIDPYGNNLGLGFLYTIGVLAICYPISYVLNKYLPWMVGHRALSPHEQKPFQLKTTKPSL